MMNNMLLFLVLLQLHLAVCVDLSSLRLVNVVFRHGDRSPVSIFPKDVNQIDSWPDGLGWLSSRGMNQHYRLGQWLRNRYDGFLNSSYIHTEIEVASSNEDRCLMSAYSNLAGLYPPQGRQIWQSNITWQPIPVHTRPEKEDNVINMGMSCPNYDKFYSQLLNSEEIKEEEKMNKQFYKLVGKESGWSHENISNIWRVADTLFCEKEHGLKPNPWADKIAPSPNKDNLTVYEKLRKLDDWQFGLMYQGKQLSKLKGGPLLKEIIDNMQKTMNHNSSVKFYMFSGHDTTVAALLSTLGLFNQLSPPYAAMDIIELHQNSEGYYVNILYKNETDKAYNLTVPGCQKDCMFTDFIKLTKDVIPTDWEAECGLPSNSTSSKLTLPVIVSIILGGILFLLLVTLVITCFHYQRKRGVTYNKFNEFQA